MHTFLQLLPGLGIVAALALSWFANVNSRRARELGEKRFRSLALSARITAVESDHAVLADSVERISVSVRKLRNRKNSDDAREKRKENGAEELTDEEWLARANKQLALGDRNYGGTT